MIYRRAAVGTRFFRELNGRIADENRHAGTQLPIQSDASSVANVADAASVGTVTERESAT